MSKSHFPKYIFPLKNSKNYLKDPKSNFVGRKEIAKKIYLSIKGAYGRGGSFLIGGYRGVGKTLLVDKIIDLLEKDNYSKHKRIKLIPINLFFLFFAKNRFFKKIHNEFDSTNNHSGIRDFSDNEFNQIKVRLNLGVDKNLLIREVLCDIAESLNSKITQINKRAIKLSVAHIIFLTAFLFPLFSFTKHLIPLTVLKAFYPLLLFCSLLFSSLIFLWFYRASTICHAHTLSQKLIRSIRFQGITQDSMGLKGTLNISLSKTLKEEKISTRRIQQELQNLFFVLSHYHTYLEKIPFIAIDKYQTIIIIDEVDKINPNKDELEQEANKSRKDKVDNLLGGLKSLLSDTNAIFIFIAGREMVDAYYSESGYTSVLYEGVFQGVFYVPTLLSDDYVGPRTFYGDKIYEYVSNLIQKENPNQSQLYSGRSGINKINYIIDEYCKSYENFIKNNNNNDKLLIDDQLYKYLTEKTNSLKPTIIHSDLVSLHKSNTKFILEIFLKHLILHSWGNVKRLSMLVREYIYNTNDLFNSENDNINNPSEKFIASGIIQKSETEACFIFNSEDVRRFMFSAKLFTLFNWGIGSQISTADDKLVVSGLMSVLDIMKFHGQGFMRGMLDRTVAGIDVHAEINLVNIIDDLINSTFYSIIRRVNNNLFQYRFYLTADIEASYVNKFIGMRSASFEFSLDSADPVRQYYLRETERLSKISVNNSSLTLSKLQMIIGDIYLSERNYDKSYSYYTNAIYLLKNVLRDPNSGGWRVSGGISIESHFLLIQILLKKGLLEEIRENYHLASKIYDEARVMAQLIFAHPINSNIGNNTESSGDIDKRIYSGYANLYPISNKNLNKLLNRDFYSNYKGPKNNNHYPQNTKFILHSILASDFLKLKSSSEPNYFYYKKLIPFNPSHTDPELYTKIALLNYYSGEFLHIVKNGHILLTTPKQFSHLTNNEKFGFHFFRDKNINTFSYLYGHSLLSLCSKILKRTFDTLTKNKISNRSTLLWLNLFFEIHNMKIHNQFHELHLDTERSKDVKKIVDLASKKDKWDTFTNSIKSEKSNTFFKSYSTFESLFNSLRIAFSLINISARDSAEKGFHTMSSHYYLSIILNYTAILEMQPWSDINVNTLKDSIEKFDLENLKNTNDEKSFLKKNISKLTNIKNFCKIHCFDIKNSFNKEDRTPSWIYSIFEDALKSIEKSDLGSYIVDRVLANKPYKSTEVNNKDLGLRLKNLYRAIGDENEDTPVSHLNYLSIWYRPNVANYLFMFLIWQKYAIISISYRLTITIKKIHNLHYTVKLPSFNIEQLTQPPNNLPRVTSIYMLLKARYRMLKLIHELKLLEVTDKNQIRSNLEANKNNIIKIFDLLFSSLKESRMTAKSEDSDTFPPKYIIYYNIYELIQLLNFSFSDNEENKNFLREYRIDFEEQSSYFFHIFDDPSQLLPYLERYANDLSDIGVIISNSFRRKIRHKYYLFDDYEDPFYVAEWSFLNMLAAGANLHLASAESLSQKNNGFNSI